MKQVHVTGVDHAPDGTLVVRTITVSRRWWQRRDRHVLRVYKGWLGQWQGVDGSPAPKYIAVVLDNAYTSAQDNLATEGLEKHAGYNAEGFAMGEQRVVFAARQAVVNPDN